MESKIARVRASRGGVYEDRGKFYMRVVVAPQERRSALLPWATTRESAVARAQAVQTLVNRLRVAGDAESYVEKLVEQAAVADDAIMAQLGRGVELVLAGKGIRVDTPATAAQPLTFEAFAMRWVKGELAEKYPDHVERKKSAYQDLCNLRKYVFPVIGPKAIARRHARGLRARHERDRRARKAEEAPPADTPSHRPSDPTRDAARRVPREGHRSEPDPDERAAAREDDRRVAVPLPR